MSDSFSREEQMDLAGERRWPPRDVGQERQIVSQQRLGR